MPGQTAIDYQENRTVFPFVYFLCWELDFDPDRAFSPVLYLLEAGESLCVSRLGT